MFTKYSVAIGDTVWEALYNHVEENYSIVGVYEEEEQKFAVLNSDGKYFRLDFSINEENFEFSDMVEFSEYTPEEEFQFSESEVAEYAKKKKEEKEEENSEDDSDSNNDEDNSDDNDDDEEDKKKKKKTEYSADEEKCSKCGKPLNECECGKQNYNLEEIPEYIDLVSKYSDLESKYNTLVSENSEMKDTISTLTEFKNKVDKKEKEAMINSFYMLSDEDKADVVENIDTYSLNDIEAKLSIICVRNKVSFDLEEEENKANDVTTYSLDGTGDDASMPAWVKAALQVAKNM